MICLCDIIIKLVLKLISKHALFACLCRVIYSWRLRLYSIHPVRTRRGISMKYHPLVLFVFPQSPCIITFSFNIIINGFYINYPITCIWPLTVLFFKHREIDKEWHGEELKFLGKASHLDYIFFPFIYHSILLLYFGPKPEVICVILRCK